MGSFKKAFLMTYQSFTTPKVLLSKLIQRYQVPKMEEMEPEEYQKFKTSFLAKMYSEKLSVFTFHFIINPFKKQF